MEKTVYEVHIIGIRPLLMHNGRLADPIDPATIRLAQLTSKRKKTMEDHHNIARAEWDGGIYLCDGKVVIPSDLIDATLRDGAKEQRKGKAMVAGVNVEDDYVPLIYDGPQNWRELYDYKTEAGSHPFVERRGAKVKQARIIRTRPRFLNWELKFKIARWDFASVGASEMKQALEFAGVAVGLGDFRPRFGLFRVEKFKELKANAKAA